MKTISATRQLGYLKTEVQRFFEPCWIEVVDSNDLQPQFHPLSPKLGRVRFQCDTIEVGGNRPEITVTLYALQCPDQQWRNGSPFAYEIEIWHPDFCFKSEHEAIPEEGVASIVLKIAELWRENEELA